MPSVLQTYLLTADLERSRTFCERGLGLAPKREGETSVSYETGACELKLQADFEPETLARFNLEPPEDRQERGEGLVVVVEVGETLEAVHGRIDRLDDESGVALTEPRDVPWSERMFLARDPNGYTYEVRAGETDR